MGAFDPTILLMDMHNKLNDVLQPDIYYCSSSSARKQRREIREVCSNIPVRI